MDRLEAVTLGLLPAGPALYPADTVTDQPETFFVAETVREKLFLALRQEVPYACAVRVEEVVERGPDAPLYIRGEIFVERAVPEGYRHRRGRRDAQAHRPGRSAGARGVLRGARCSSISACACARTGGEDDRAFRELGYQRTS